MLLFTGSVLNGQVLEQKRRMSLGEQNALVLEIKNVDIKTVESVWKDFFGNFGRSKKNRKTDEFYITDAQIPALGISRTVDLYAQISGSDNNVTVVHWFDMRGGFLSAAEYAQQYPAAVKLVQDFNLEVKRTVLEADLKEQEKLLSRLESDMKKLMRDNESLHKIIEQATERIAKAELDIEQNLKDQESKKSEIETQRNTVKEVQQKVDKVGKSN
jgi:translation initiation factor 2B subunit (eIF-2B alpha/beta/delta family)